MLKKSSAVLKMTALALIVALTVSVIPFGVTAERIDRIPTAVIDASEKYAPNATITAGQDDSYRYMTWYNETEGKQYVKWVEADKVIDGVFPEDCYQTEVGPAVRILSGDRTLAMLHFGLDLPEFLHLRLIICLFPSGYLGLMVYFLQPLVYIFFIW